MKYTIETTEDGWVETLEISGQTYARDVAMVTIGAKREILLIE